MFSSLSRIFKPTQHQLTSGVKESSPLTNGGSPQEKLKKELVLCHAIDLRIAFLPDDDEEDFDHDIKLMLKNIQNVLNKNDVFSTENFTKYKKELVEQMEKGSKKGSKVVNKEEIQKVAEEFILAAIYLARHSSKIPGKEVSRTFLGEINTTNSIDSLINYQKPKIIPSSSNSSAKTILMEFKAGIMGANDSSYFGTDLINESSKQSKKEIELNALSTNSYQRNQAP